jgi:hypothetical protein
LTAIAVGLTGQLLVCAKSPGLVPVTAIPLIVSGLGPLFVSVIARALLVVFTIWFGKLMDVGARVTVDGTIVPVPLRLTDCGLAAPLSVIVIAAERALAAAGVKVTLIVQKPFTGTVVGLSGQLFVCAKSPGLVPVTAIPLIVSGLGPLFVTVIPCEPLVVPRVWLGKLTAVGKKVTVDGTSVPVPLRPIDCGLLPVTITAAERALAASGVKVTAIVQTPFVASVAGLIGQLLVCAKSPGLVPVMAIPLIVATPGPLLVMVMPCAVLVVFTV